MSPPVSSHADVYAKKGSEVEDTFWSRVDVRGPEECWTARGRKNTSGYIQASVDGVLIVAHRVAWVFTNGPVPAGHDIDHTCHNADAECRETRNCPHRRCVNPAHLEAVTHAENCRRGNAGRHFSDRTHCAKGHPFAGENLVIVHRPDGTTIRQCHLCKQENGRRAYTAKLARRTAA